MLPRIRDMLGQVAERDGVEWHKSVVAQKFDINLNYRCHPEQDCDLKEYLYRFYVSIDYILAHFVKVYLFFTSSSSK